MKRGWTVAGGADYAGKPRPAVIVQDDHFDATDSITLCVFTTDPTEAPLFRILVQPNGLHEPSRPMLDKITTVPKARLGSRVSRLDAEDIVRMNRAILVFLREGAPRRRGSASACAAAAFRRLLHAGAVGRETDPGAWLRP